MKKYLSLLLVLSALLASCTLQERRNARDLAIDFLKEAGKEAAVTAAEASLIVAEAKLAEAEADLAEYKASLGVKPDATDLAKLKMYEQALASAQKLRVQLVAQVAKLRSLPLPETLPTVEVTASSATK